MRKGTVFFAPQMEDEDLVREDARNLRMLEWARELLVGEGEYLRVRCPFCQL